MPGIVVTMRRQKPAASPGLPPLGVAAFVLVLALPVPACSSDGATEATDDGPGSGASGGAGASTGTGGGRGSGGSKSSQGGTTSGGVTNDSGGARTGGTSSSGGRSNGGGQTAGGSTGAGGNAAGGNTNAGGNATGGTVNTGGNAMAGSTGTGGGKATGGSANTGGSNAAGGSSNAGGSQGAGGSGNTAACPGKKPDPTNTGVPPGVSLTVVNGDVTVSMDDTTIDARDIHGFLSIKASRVRVTRSIVRGGVATANGAGIRVQSGTGILIEDTEVALANPSAYLDGISGSNFTVRRANVHGGVDGMKVGSNSNVECSYIHDMTSFDSDPNQGGGPTHNDAIQILSGTGIHIVGNQLVAAKNQNAGIQVTQDFGAVGDLHIESNWADGGGCTFNFAHKGGTSLTLSATNNRFGRNSFYGCPILKSTQTTLTASGNVYDDDGSPVPVQTHD
jgi:hypothetical protein